MQWLNFGGKIHKGKEKGCMVCMVVFVYPYKTERNGLFRDLPAFSWLFCKTELGIIDKS
jgi:hypothetical protein